MSSSNLFRWSGVGLVLAGLPSVHLANAKPPGSQGWLCVAENSSGNADYDIRRRFGGI